MRVKVNQEKTNSRCVYKLQEEFKNVLMVVKKP